jgi:trans-2,3-dihydro-3-hydroxyanthranilate isomerase
MARPFLQYDVFTAEPLTGNQLAVFLDGRGLDAERMQSIAREMNFSETTFVLPAERPATNVRMRIFTPALELPMAGHPVIGTTFALAHAGTIAPGTRLFVFGLGVGPTPVDLEWDGDRLRFAWMTQPLPAFAAVIADRSAAAAAIGLEVADLVADLPVQQVSCGLPYTLIPLRDNAAVDRASAEVPLLRRLAEHGVLLFAINGRAETYSRMFAPQSGVIEDPATGSASGPLGAYLVRHGVVSGAVARRILNLQGVAMRRPSRLHIHIEGTADAITSVKVGGEAVLVAEGKLLV